MESLREMIAGPSQSLAKPIPQWCEHELEKASDLFHCVLFAAAGASSLGVSARAVSPETSERSPTALFQARSAEPCGSTRPMQAEAFRTEARAIAGESS